MKKGVIYARYSCDKQTENSTKAQLRECREWAEKNDITVIDTYCDEAISGRTDRRPAFQKMIADAQRGYFECIVVWKGDRFSRSRADAAKYKTMLKKLGIRVLSVTEPNIEGSQAILMDGINEAFAEYYSVELAEKINRGLDQNALDGKWNGGAVPLGYDHDPKTQRLSINEKEAEVVRKIFKLYTEDQLSANAIGVRLQQEGFITKRGKLISKAGVYSVLTHECYTGVYHWRQYTVKNIFPPIIDEETYQAAQALLKKNCHSRGVKSTGIEYFLAGRLYCGQCGRKMVGRSGYGGHNHKKYYYYSCKDTHGKRVCPMKDVPKDLIEESVIRILREKVLLDKGMREYFTDAILGYVNGENPEIPALEKELDELNAKIMKLVLLAEEMDDIEEVAERLKALKSKREGIQENLRLLKHRVSSVDAVDVNSFFDHLASCPFETPEDRRFLVNTFLHKAYVFDDGHITLYLNYRGQISTFMENGRVRMSSPMVHQTIINIRIAYYLCGSGFCFHVIYDFLERALMR